MPTGPAVAPEAPSACWKYDRVVWNAVDEFASGNGVVRPEAEITGDHGADTGGGSGEHATKRL